MLRINSLKELNPYFRVMTFFTQNGKHRVKFFPSRLVASKARMTKLIWDSSETAAEAENLSTVCREFTNQRTAANISWKVKGSKVRGRGQNHTLAFGRSPRRAGIFFFFFWETIPWVEAKYNGPSRRTFSIDRDGLRTMAKAETDTKLAGDIKGRTRRQDRLS